jgi:hypothetical protein
MPTSTSPPSSDLTPVQRRQQLAGILARGVLRLLRQRQADARKESTEIATEGLDRPPASRLNVPRG